MGIFKNKSRKTEIESGDYKKFLDKYSEYRYLVVCGKEKKPLAMCKDIESAKDECRVHTMGCGELPVKIIDLLCLKG